MKGQTMELLNLAFLVVALSILLTVSYFMSNKLVATRKDLVYFSKYRVVTELPSQFFYTKLPFIKKTVAQLIGDEISEKSDVIYYGDFPEGTNVTEILLQVMNRNFDDRWHLRVLDNSGKELIDIGNPASKDSTTMVFPLPIPSYVGEVVYVEVKIW